MSIMRMQKQFSMRFLLGALSVTIGLSTFVGQSSYAAEPTKVKTGMYIMSLYNIDPGGGKYSADMWLWFNSPSGKFKLLKSREFLNTQGFKSLTSDIEIKGDVEWASEKVKGTFLQDFDISTFPFDRHDLKIVLEESITASDELMFEVDAQNSTIDPKIVLEGWQITGFKLEPQTNKYLSKFGDPEPGSATSYSRIVATISLKRADNNIFIKTTMGLYIAIAIMLIAFFMRTDLDDVFSGRIGLMVGMVFAIVISQQSSETSIGKSITMTLVDRLHMYGLAFVFVAIALSLISRRHNERGYRYLATRIEQITIPIFGISFVLINYVLIVAAKAGEPMSPWNLKMMVLSLLALSPLFASLTLLLKPQAKTEVEVLSEEVVTLKKVV